MSAFANYLLKYKEFFRVSFSRNIRTAFFSENIINFLEFPFPDAWEIFSGWNFLFFDLGLKSAWFYFSKYKKDFLLRKYKKSFLLRKYKNFFILKFHFQNFFQGRFYFLGGSLGLKVAQVVLIYYTFIGFHKTFRK